MDPVQVGNPGLVLALLFIHTILASGEQQKLRRPPDPLAANTVIMAIPVSSSNNVYQIEFFFGGVLPLFLSILSFSYITWLQMYTYDEAGR